MDKTGVFPIKNNASNLAGLMFSIVDTTTAMKRPLMLRNNVFSNFTSSNFAPRKSLNDEVSSDRKGKRKIVNEIDFFSSEKRKMPKLEPGLQPSLVSHIKEEDITLQIGLQFTDNSEEEESLRQAYKRVEHELAMTKAELRRLGEEKSTMTEEINRLSNMVADLRENYCYRIALLPKGHHQGNPAVNIPSAHTIKRMIIEKQHRENYQVSETNQRVPHV